MCFIISEEVDLDSKYCSMQLRGSAADTNNDHTNKSSKNLTFLELWLLKRVEEFSKGVEVICFYRLFFWIGSYKQTLATITITSEFLASQNSLMIQLKLNLRTYQNLQPKTKRLTPHYHINLIEYDLTNNTRVVCHGTLDRIGQTLTTNKMLLKQNKTNACANGRHKEIIIRNYANVRVR